MTPLNSASRQVTIRLKKLRLVCTCCHAQLDNRLSFTEMVHTQMLS